MLKKWQLKDVILPVSYTHLTPNPCKILRRLFPWKSTWIPESCMAEPPFYPAKDQ